MTGVEELVMNWRSAMIGLIIACSLIALVYLYRRGIERAAVGWFALFVVAACVSAVPMLIGFAGAYDVWPGLTFLPTQTGFLLGPALVLHARSLMIDAPNTKLYWLFGPGIIYLTYQLWAFTLLGDYRSKWAFNDALHEPYIFPVAMVLTWLLVGACLAYVWRLRSKYLEWLKHNRSDDDRFSPAWLTHLVVLAALAGIFWAIEVSVAQALDFSYADVFVWDFIALFAVFIISLEALAGINHSFPKMPGSNGTNANEPTALPGKDWVLEGARLKAQVLENKWHLEAGLSLQSLARRFGTNQVYLSRAINQGLGENFSMFINGLRVEHAKQLIEQGEQSMIEVALTSGFGSKASFNRAFKHHTGQSPSEYRSAKLVS